MSEVSDYLPTDQPDEHFVRHWSPQSEKFASGDALITALANGWQVVGVIFRQEHWHAGARRVCVYHFKLSRNDETNTMIVVQNPYVSRFVDKLPVQVVLINQRKTMKGERW
jgi:hypothetical protein